MRKLYEIFKVLQIQIRIVSTETITGNTVNSFCIKRYQKVMLPTLMTLVETELE